MMTHIEHKSQILDLNRQERQALVGLLGQLTPAQMTTPGVHADWTIKDDLAHIVDWEQRMIHWIEVSLQGETPQQPEPGMTWDDLDKLNERIRREYRDLTLDEVFAAFERSYAEATEAVENLSEHDLLDPGRFPWRQGNPLWQMVAANMWEHYREHRAMIESWLANQEQRA